MDKAIGRDDVDGTNPSAVCDEVKEEKRSSSKKDSRYQERILVQPITREEDGTADIKKDEEQDEPGLWLTAFLKQGEDGDGLLFPSQQEVISSTRTTDITNNYDEREEEEIKKQTL